MYRIIMLAALIAECHRRLMGDVGFGSFGRAGAASATRSFSPARQWRRAVTVTVTIAVTGRLWRVRLSHGDDARRVHIREE